MIVGSIAFLVVLGAISIIIVSRRLRAEVGLLVASFDRTERLLVPLVATIRSDSDRLAERLASLTEPRTGVDETWR